MSVDDRIRDALDASVATPDLDLDALDGAETDVRASLAGRTRRRHRTVVASASALAAAAVVLVAALVWPGPNHETVNTGAFLPPATVTGAGHLVSVAWPGGGAKGEVVIRSAATGRVERTLSVITPSHAGGVSLSATADGRYLYYGWHRGDGCSGALHQAACTIGGIDRISLAAGSVTTQSRQATYALAVSPDGRYLAATHPAPPTDSTTLNLDEVDVTDLRTGIRQGFSVRDTTYSPLPLARQVQTLSFAPDDRHIALSIDQLSYDPRALGGPVSSFLAWILDTRVPIDSANPHLVAPSDASAGAGVPAAWAATYYGSSEELVALELCAHSPCSSPPGLFTIDLSTGISTPLAPGPPMTSGAVRTLASSDHGVVYGLMSLLCPPCQGPGSSWKIVRLDRPGPTVIASGSVGVDHSVDRTPTPQGLAWIP